jgi:hypothetical protein
MKTRILVMLLLAPMLILAQVKGKKSKNAFTTTSGTEFKVGEMITLKKASNSDKFAFAYVNKSGLSIGNALKAARSLKNLKNGNVSNLSTTINAVNSIASSGLLDGTMSKLMNKAVSSKYVSENALDATLSKTSYKIKNFKIYKDKKSGEKIVHAIAKGNGKTVAILLEFAEKAGEISK